MDADNPRPAVVHHPGRILADEMRERDWDVIDMRTHSGLSIVTVRDLLMCRQDITPHIAACLARALGTSAELWLNMQAAYDARQEATDGR